MLRRLSAIAVFIALFTAPVARAEVNPGGFVPADPRGPFPTFNFADADGKMKSLADFRGRPVLVNLWATWCGPCVREMPSLDRLQAQMADTKLVIITLDQEDNSADLTRNFFKRYDIHNLGLYSDPGGHLAAQMHLRGIPYSFLIDADGNMNGFVPGGTDWSAPTMVEFLRQRIAMPPVGAASNAPPNKL